MDNVYDTVRLFEQKMAEYAGAPYAVAVDSCSSALFLSFQYVKEHIAFDHPVYVPKYTYPSAPLAVLHAGGKIIFTDDQWQGCYQFYPYNIWDSAVRMRKGMFNEIGHKSRPDVPRLYCLSFHHKKHIPIGRGGMILTGHRKAYDWLKLARFDGRKEGQQIENEEIKMRGWHMYMDPEKAARGLCLMWNLRDDNPDLEGIYPDLSRSEVFGG